MQKFLDSSNCTWITFHEYTTHSGHTHAIPYHPTSSSSLSSSNIPHNKTRDHHLWSSRDDHKTLKSFLERASLLSLDWTESHYGRHAALESSVMWSWIFSSNIFLCFFSLQSHMWWSATKLDIRMVDHVERKTRFNFVLSFKLKPEWSSNDPANIQEHINLPLFEGVKRLCK